MKKLGFSVLFLSFSAVLVVGNQAQAKQQKHPKYKVVTVSFSEDDARNMHRMPASIDEKEEVDAANRLAARHTAEKLEIPD